MSSFLSSLIHHKKKHKKKTLKVDPASIDIGIPQHLHTHPTAPHFDKGDVLPHHRFINGIVDKGIVSIPEMSQPRRDIVSIPEILVGKNFLETNGYPLVNVEKLVGKNFLETLPKPQPKTIKKMLKKPKKVVKGARTIVKKLKNGGKVVTVMQGGRVNFTVYDKHGKIIGQS